jgi:hypothetical protein
MTATSQSAPAVAAFSYLHAVHAYPGPVSLARSSLSCHPEHDFQYY